MKVQKSNIIRGLLLFFILILVNIGGFYYFERFDLTDDQRYTLSPAAKEIIAEIESPIIIDVFLEGDFPPEFQKLQFETRQLLEEFAAYNPNVKFNFINPLEDGGDATAIATEFYQMGMTPARINVVENGRTTEAIVFPWAMANFKNESIAIPLLKSKIGATTEERVSSSIQNLEYAFADAFSRLVNPKKKKIAVMRGNGELEDAYIADFVRSLQDYYYTAAFTLDSVAVDPKETLSELREFDLIIEAKPTEPYTEAEKYVLDQYIMSGGKALWMLEHVAMETDSLFSAKGSAFALPRDLNLGDFFFKYGLRINPVLVKDIYSAPIILASGRGSEATFNPFPWLYYPLSSSPSKHPIVNNLEAVRFMYANPIDTLNNEIEKTILLSSSPSTQLVGTPQEINLDEIEAKPDLSGYTDGEQALAVLLEGSFTSVFKNRVKPFELENPIVNGVPTAMVVISDGDVVKNELRQGEVLELGFDQYTGTTFGNKEFLMNSVNYLLDDTGLVDIRSKEVSIAFLNLEEVDENRTLWQIINLLGPLFLLAIFGLFFIYFRRKKYIRR